LSNAIRALRSRHSSSGSWMLLAWSMSRASQSLRSLTLTVRSSRRAPCEVIVEQRDSEIDAALLGDVERGRRGRAVDRRPVRSRCPRVRLRRRRPAGAARPPRGGGRPGGAVCGRSVGGSPFWGHRSVASPGLVVRHGVGLRWCWVSTTAENVDVEPAACPAGSGVSRLLSLLHVGMANCAGSRTLPCGGGLALSTQGWV
jgi:hypothetical protein